MPRQSHAHDGEITARRACALAACAAPALVFASAAACAVADGAQDFQERYRAILDAPVFGRPPAIPAPDEFAFPAPAQDADGASSEAVDLFAAVRLVALTRFQGKPAAGLVDARSGRVVYLLAGQGVGDFTLESVALDKGSVTVSKGALTNEIFMSYAAGQATNLTAFADSAYMSVLDVRNAPPAAMRAEEPLPAQNAAPALAGAPPAPPAPASAQERYSAEDLAAATVTDEKGVARVSFRELHRLRVQREREAKEAERRGREERLAAEKASREQSAKEEAERAAAAKKEAEAARRREVVDALKAGYDDVDLDFELSAAEKRELVQAGYDIPGFEPDDARGDAPGRADSETVDADADEGGAAPAADPAAAE